MQGMPSGADMADLFLPLAIVAVPIAFTVIVALLPDKRDGSDGDEDDDAP